MACCINTKAKAQEQATTATVARVKSSGQCPSTQTLLLPELEERRGRGHLTGPRDRVEVRGGEGGTTPDLVRGRIAEA